MSTKKNATRNGKPLANLAKGDRRRLSDGRNAWRKMTPEQRRVFLDWMAEEALEVAPAEEPEEIEVEPVNPALGMRAE